jgi:septum formation protein
MTDFYLASHSERRRALLEQVGARFEVLRVRALAPRGPDVGEDIHEGESPAHYVERVAREKAEHGMRTLGIRSLPSKAVLGADTVVVVDGQVLGKPRDAAQAAGFLQRLAGRTHEVRTAVALMLPGTPARGLLSSLSVSLVTMRSIDAGEIARYCAGGEPLDKAGGYGLQGLGAIFVQRIEGSYSGIVGLPLAETADLLARAGVRLV